jgi:hypothetical protein
MTVGDGQAADRGPLQKTLLTGLEVGAGVAVDLETDSDLSYHWSAPHGSSLHKVKGFSQTRPGIEQAERR